MILVAGAGSIGQLLAARLQAAGHDVQCLVRERFVQPLQDLKVEGHTDFHGTLDVVTEPVGPYDTVFLTCKAHQTVATARQVLPHLADDGVIVSLQNGLGNGDKLVRIVGAPRSAVALTANGAYIPQPGRLVHAGNGTTQVGPAAPGDDDAARRAEALLADAGLHPDYQAPIRGAEWMKAIINAALNPVAALHGVRNGAVLEEPLWSDAQALAEEAYALSRAAGVRLPDDADPVATLRTVCTRTADNRCSMVQDVTAQKPTEVEQITGHLVRSARRLGYPMPRSEEAYRAIKDLEASYLGAAEALRLTREETEWDADADGS